MSIRIVKDKIVVTRCRNEFKSVQSLTRVAKQRFVSVHVCACVCAALLPPAT